MNNNELNQTTVVPPEDHEIVVPVNKTGKVFNEGLYGYKPPKDFEYPSANTYDCYYADGTMKRVVDGVVVETTKVVPDKVDTSETGKHARVDPSLKYDDSLLKDGPKPVRVRQSGRRDRSTVLLASDKDPMASRRRHIKTLIENSLPYLNMTDENKKIFARFSYSHEYDKVINTAHRKGWTSKRTVRYIMSQFYIWSLNN